MSLPVTADPLPTSVTFGKVVGRVIHLIADTAEDTDDKPQARAAIGRVVFAPKDVVRKTTEADYPAIVLHATETATLSGSGRILDAEGRQGIWLAAGVYTVTFEITGAPRAIPTFDIQVTTAHTDAAPLDLAKEAPYVAPTGTLVQTVLIPSGGTTGQVLVRAADGQLAWANQSGGTGGTGSVASVNGKTGTVVLSAADVGAQPAGSYATLSGGTVPDNQIPASIARDTEAQSYADAAKARANHTGTQPASTVTGLDSASATSVADGTSQTSVALGTAIDSATHPLGVAARGAFLPRWAPAEAVTANVYRLSPDGTIIKRTADGTTRPNWDATEQGAWTGGMGSGSATVDKPGVYIPEGSLDVLAPALNATSTTLVEMTYFGDSTGFGSGGDGGPVRKLRSLALAAGLTDGGRGVASPNESASSSGETLAPLVSRTGFAGAANGYDSLNTDTLVSDTPGDIVTMRGKGTAVRINATRAGTSGPFTYSIDGGAAVTVDATKPANVTADILTTYVGGLSEGTHTVAITNTGAAGSGGTPNPGVGGPPMNGVSAHNDSGATVNGSWEVVATSVTQYGESTPGTPITGATSVGRSLVVSADARSRVGQGVTTIKFYARVAGTSDAYGFIASAPIAASNAFTATTWSGTPPMGAAPPTTDTSGGTSGGGTAGRCAVSVEFVRATGIVIHKQAISGIASTGFFDATRSSNAAFANGPALAALGLSQMREQVSVNGADWGQTPAAKPRTRRVKGAVFALGLNDVNVADATAARTKLDDLVEAFGLFVRMTRAAGADPILVVEHFDYYGDNTSSRNGTRARAGLTSAARSMGVPYVDYNVALGPVNAGPYTGAPHLSQAAYDTEAAFLWNNILAPAVETR